jgi:hypothetical protein
MLLLGITPQTLLSLSLLIEDEMEGFCAAAPAWMASAHRF